MDIKELERQILDVYSTLMYGLLKLNKRISKIEPGSGNVNTVNGKTGDVVLDASDVGAIASTEKGAANGVATLGNDGKVPVNQLPSISGGNVRMSKLWENSNPTSAFSVGNIPLSSNDYDMLMCQYKYYKTTSLCMSCCVNKGESFRLETNSYSSSNAPVNGWRVLNRTSDTEYFAESIVSYPSVLNNDYIIPLRIYGIKLL